MRPLRRGFASAAKQLSRAKPSPLSEIRECGSNDCKMMQILTKISAVARLGQAAEIFVKICGTFCATCRSIIMKIKIVSGSTIFLTPKSIFS